MMKTVEFKYDVAESVYIKAIEMRGTIDALCLDVNGIQYRVIYWFNGTRSATWLYDWEIEKK